MKTRHLIQLVFFIISVGLLVLIARELILADVHEFCPYSIICFGLSSHLTIIYTAMIVSCVILASCIVFGRWFCTYICYFGSLSEFLFSWLYTGKIKLAGWLDTTLLYLKYIVLLATVTLAWLGVAFFISFCPHVIFTNLSLIFGIGLGIILLLSVFINRPWCRYLCPYGALQSIVINISYIFKKKKKNRSIE